MFHFSSRSFPKKHFPQQLWWSGSHGCRENNRTVPIPSKSWPRAAVPKAIPNVMMSWRRTTFPKSHGCLPILEKINTNKTIMPSIFKCVCVCVFQLQWQNTALRLHCTNVKTLIMELHNAPWIRSLFEKMNEPIVRLHIPLCWGHSFSIIMWEQIVLEWP